MTLENVLKWAPLARQLTVDCSLPIDAITILGIIYMESRGDPNAVNKRSGATGLMQVMPFEANPEVFGDRPTQQELLNPRTNMAWGIKILRHNLKGEERTLKEALYAYSGGSYWGSFDDYETRYWRLFLKARLALTRELMGEVFDVRQMTGEGDDG